MLEMNKAYHNEAKFLSILSFLSYWVGMEGILGRSKSKYPSTMKDES